MVQVGELDRRGDRRSEGCRIANVKQLSLGSSRDAAHALGIDPLEREADDVDGEARVRLGDVHRCGARVLLAIVRAVVNEDDTPGCSRFE